MAITGKGISVNATWLLPVLIAFLHDSPTLKILSCTIIFISIFEPLIVGD